MGWGWGWGEGEGEGEGAGEGEGSEHLLPLLVVGERLHDAQRVELHLLHLVVQQQLEHGVHAALQQRRPRRLRGHQLLRVRVGVGVSLRVRVRVRIRVRVRVKG